MDSTGPFSFANLSNAAFIDELYSAYKKDPSQVDPSWKQFFEGMELGISSGPVQQDMAKGPTDIRIQLLIDAYRRYGHLRASINPIAIKEEPHHPELDLQRFGFEEGDLESEVPTCGFLPSEKTSLKSLLEALKKTYSGKIGFEYMGCISPAFESWMQEQIEPLEAPPFTAEEKKQILHSLNRSEIFESFIHIKYPGQKRFSLEGGETLIPILAEILNRAGNYGAIECLIGMAHRGRLNVLANILGKSYSMIFHEFEDHYQPSTFEGSGDVKYHKGFSGDVTTLGGKKVHVSIPANPSHLESVDPVLEGSVRARQEMKEKDKRKSVIPILIHGDAALAGQGIIYETMQMSMLEGYATGGTIHIAVNNQVGFTASPGETRSTTYCTDIAKAFGCPVFHVDAEDPESCVFAARLAAEIRDRYHCDVFIDLNCYRKYGHNEMDEPAFTQPLEYALIKNKQPIRSIFLQKLIEEKAITKEEAEGLEKKFHDELAKALQDAQRFAQEAEKIAKVRKEPPPKEDQLEARQTAIEKTRLQDIGKKLCELPASFNIHSKLKRILDGRKELLQKGEGPIDWGFAESLAFASLILEGVHIRLSGQDSRRATFSHRHAALIDQTTGKPYIALDHLSEKTRFNVYNSILSEYAVMAFDYGYALAYAKALVLWEAQYGDFANGAQVVIDQYIASAEQKWNRTCGLTLLLPHGYEGGGPEHSSARIERFLQLSGNQSMIIAVPSTSGQYFHLLRRQGRSKIKRPLIIFTPKGPLRYAPSYSNFNAFTEGSFEEIKDDPQNPKKPRRLLFCSGKVYYDLLLEKEKRKEKDIAILRIEQLYPLHLGKLKEIIEKYKGFKECVWVQEEHQNMGAWSYIQGPLKAALPEKIDLSYAGRKPSASPAAGSHALHQKEFSEFMDKAFEE